ncbi:MAG: DUF4974 domain-containing protein, partial [Hymenobacteraceae bacterium]|nr:DUF4974 domain-containing protein [Hymenobacteraceae bacterium]
MSVADASPPWDLLARQLAGEATPADEAAVRAWQAAAPANDVLWQQLTGVWTETGAASGALAFGPADAAHAWQQFESAVLGPPPTPPASSPVASPAPAPPAVPTPLLPPLAPGVLIGLGKATALLVVGVGAGWLLRTARPPAVEAISPPVTTAVAPRAVETSRTAPVAVDLIFENDPLSAVAQRVESAFPGTHVEVADTELARQRFTGTFRAARVAAVLRVVSVATGA